MNLKLSLCRTFNCTYSFDKVIVLLLLIWISALETNYLAENFIRNKICAYNVKSTVKPI